MSDINTAFNVPPNIKRSLCTGLSMIALLGEQDQRKLLTWARVPRASGLYGDKDSLISETGLPENYADHLWTAVVMMVSSIGRSSITSEDFITVGLENSAFEEEEIVGITRFSDMIIGSREEIKRENALAQLQNAVLPTLMEFELALEARVQFSEGSIEYAVPIAIAYIDTDAEDQLIWFQMNEQRIREIRNKLTTILSQIEVMNKWLTDSGS